MKQQLARAWIGFDGVPRVDTESREVIFAYKNFGALPAKIVKAASFTSNNEITADQLRSAVLNRDNMQAILYPGAARDVIFQYEDSNSLKGEYGFIVSHI